MLGCLLVPVNQHFATAYDSHEGVVSSRATDLINHYREIQLDYWRLLMQQWAVDVGFTE